MQSENRFFDDLAKLVNGAAGTVAGMSREFETNAREKAKQWIGGMDFVSRDEFDAVKALAAAAREEVELLKARLDALAGKASEPVKQTVRAKPRDGEQPPFPGESGVVPAFSMPPRFTTAEGRRVGKEGGGT